LTAAWVWGECGTARGVQAGRGGGSSRWRQGHTQRLATGQAHAVAQRVQARPPARPPARLVDLRLLLELRQPPGASQLPAGRGPVGRRRRQQALLRGAKRRSIPHQMRRGAAAVGAGGGRGGRRGRRRQRARRLAVLAKSQLAGEGASELRWAGLRGRGRSRFAFRNPAVHGLFAPLVGSSGSIASTILIPELHSPLAAGGWRSPL
jgi:hypothetical protein